MLDPNIALSVKPIEVASPLQSIGQLMQMRGVMTQQLLRQAQIAHANQQTEELKAVAEQKNRDLADSRTFQNTLAKNAAAGEKDVWGKTFKDVSGLIAPRNLIDLQNKHAETIQKQSTNDTTEIENHNKRLASIGASVGGIAQLPDLADRQSEYTNYRTRALADPQLGADAASLPETWNDDWAKQVQWAGTATQQINDAALKKQAADRAALAATDTHNKIVAEIPGITAEATKKELVTKVMQEALADPAKGATAIQSILPNDPEAAKGYIAAHNAAMAAGSPEAAARVVEAAAQHATSLSAATRANRVQTATEELKATGPLRMQQEIAKERVLMPMRTAAEINKQVALAKLAPEGFSSIISASERAKAEAGYEKDSKEYAEKAGDAARLRDFVRAAQSGNKAAPGLIPMAEVRAIVPRVNQTELKGVSSNAGSIVDRFEGWVKGHTEGEPIPPAILKDILSAADIIEGGARRNYEFKVQALNGTHGTKVKPIDFTPPAAPALVPAGPKMIQARDTAGKLHQAPEGTALPPGWKLEGK